MHFNIWLDNEDESKWLLFLNEELNYSLFHSYLNKYEENLLIAFLYSWILYREDDSIDYVIHMVNYEYVEESLYDHNMKTQYIYILFIISIQTLHFHLLQREIIEIHAFSHCHDYQKELFEILVFLLQIKNRQTSILINHIFLVPRKNVSQMIV